MAIGTLLSKALALSRSPFFDAAAYRRAHRGLGAFALWPALHYVAIGERQGLRPNAFFDPRHYVQELTATGVDPQGSPLGFYAAHGARRGESPSAEFEHAWYAWQNPDWVEGGAAAHPLRHFLEVGLRQRRDPSPRIELRRLLEALGPAAARAPGITLLQRIVERGALDGPGVTRDFAELRARQAAFREGLNHDVLRRGERRRPDLVFLQSGKGVQPAYLTEDRGFDVLRNYYADPGEDVCAASDHVLFQRGTKLTGIAGILRRDPDLLLGYEQVLFLDDDITLSAAEVERFFAAMRRSGAALAQPLLAPGSDCVWPVFKDQAHAGRVVPVNSVEVMMPAFSHEALGRLAWTFEETISGFGVDLLWGHSLPDARDAGRVVVIGEVQARHEKAIDDVGGAFYRFMAENGINPKLELWMVMREHGVVPDFRTLDRAGSEAAAAAAR